MLISERNEMPARAMGNGGMSFRQHDLRKRIGFVWIVDRERSEEGLALLA